MLQTTIQHYYKSQMYKQQNSTNTTWIWI